MQGHAVTVNSRAALSAKALLFLSKVKAVLFFRKEAAFSFPKAARCV
jgi:hypothetical protein